MHPFKASPEYFYIPIIDCFGLLRKICIMSGLDKQVSRGKIERLCYRKGDQFCYYIDRFVNKGLSDRL